MEIHPSNSRLRTIVAVALRDPRPLAGHLNGLCAEGKISDSFQREWEGGVYRLGGDWLSGAAFELINSDGSPCLRQFELARGDGWNALPFEGITFAPLSRGRVGAETPTSVTVYRAGIVQTSSPIALIWLEWGLESTDPARWLEFAAALRQMLPAGARDDYHRHFRLAQGTACTATWLISAARDFLLGPAASELAWCARDVTLCARLKLITSDPAEAGPLAAGLLHDEKAPDVLASERVDPNRADIRTSWSAAGIVVFLLQPPGARTEKGAQAFTNAFNLTDLWLAQIVPLLQRQILSRLEHEVTALVSQLHLVRAGLLRPHALRALIGARKRYERVLDAFMESYWRYGLIQLHTHGRRHGVYLGLREALRLPESASDFENKLETLGTYLGEKQKTLLGYFLVYVPFLSLVVGVLGVNVRGYTSSDGLTLPELGLVVGLVSAGYLVLIVAAVVLIQRRAGRARN